MIRKCKTMGVALVAVLALTAVMASAASAASYKASSYPTTITGSSPAGNDTFVTEGGTVECASHFQATLNAASTSLTVTPTYTNCKAFGFVNATVNMNGCDYVFGEPANVGSHLWTSKAVVSCPAGKSIEITAGTCKLAIHGQAPGGHIIIQDTTSPNGTVHEIATVTGVNYTVVTDGFGCPFTGTGAKTGATYTQHSQVAMSSTNGAGIDIG